MKILAHPKRSTGVDYNPFTCIIGLLVFFSNVSLAQTDLQWYVLNGGGRSNNSPPFQYNNPINAVFTIQGITHPNRACNILAKNELFIIYSDSTHFNSRENATTASVYPIDFFYPRPPNSTVLESTTHHFHTVGNKSVLYLYKTSKYEGDEPPRTIQVGNTPGATARDTIYKPWTTIPASILSASHDVVRNKDITLIVNYAKLIQDHGIDTNTTYYLQYDKVQSRDVGSRVVSHPAFFDLEPVFTYGTTHQPSFPANTIDEIASVAKVRLINPGSDYIYINLHPTNQLASFYPNTPDGAVRYDALFEIYKEIRIAGDVAAYTPELFHPEQIRLSHDPNKLVVQSICKKLKSTYVCYHLEFTNTSFTPAQNIEVEMDFPDDFEDRCIAISSWKIGGIEVSGGNTVLCGGKIRAIFPPKLTLLQCQSDQSNDLCTGSLDFCIKVNTTENVFNLEYSVEPTVNIYFDGVAYPLDHFVDPFIQDTFKQGFSARRPPPVTECETHCNFICLPCQPCIKYPFIVLPVVLSGFALLWWFYRRSRLRATKKT